MHKEIVPIGQIEDSLYGTIPIGTSCDCKLSPVWRRKFLSVGLRYSLTMLDANTPISLRLAHFCQFKTGRLGRSAFWSTPYLVEQTLGQPIHLPKICRSTSIEAGGAAGRFRERSGPRRILAAMTSKSAALIGA